MSEATMSDPTDVETSALPLQFTEAAAHKVKKVAVQLPSSKIPKGANWPLFYSIFALLSAN